MTQATVTPAFTRRHYQQIADALQGARENYDEGGSVRFGVDVAAESLCALLSEDNSRFDHERFLKACGVQS